VQHGDQIWLHALELGPEHVPEQMVIPVPLPAVVEGDDEEIRLLQDLKTPCRVVPTEQLVAERPAHPVEHGGSHEELPVRAFEAREMLGTKVIGDEPVVPVKGLDRARVLALLDGERREVEAGGPALSPLVQLMRLRFRQLRTGRSQERLRLRVAQSELGVADLMKLRGCAQLGQRQAVLGPSGEDELRPAGKVLCKRLEDVYTVPLREHMNIVED
jgi:hypothetical protein